MRVFFGPLFVPALLSAQAPSIARINISPASPSVVVGQELRLTAQAVDGAGNPVPGAIIRFQRQGSPFEGSIDSTGLVKVGSPGTISVSVTAIVEGHRPFVQRLDIPAVPGPAATIDVDPQPVRLLAGQQVALRTQVRSANKDLRPGDQVRWSSSSTAVARFAANGMLVAVAPGRATITGTAGAARKTFAVEVLAPNVGSVTLTPSTINARTGDVVRFKASVKDAAGREIAGLTPTWLMNGGEGLMDPDGAFVAYQPGTFTVMALLGRHSASATVTTVPRDVRRPATIVGAARPGGRGGTEAWVHANGKVAYFSSGGQVFSIDISDPAAPVIVDSVRPNARSINDVMSSEDGKVLVVTREGAADRRNGIAIYTLDDPLHPRYVSEFADPVTAGVHSAYINTQPAFGRFVYLAPGFLGRMYIVDITDPARPKQVATWEVPRTDAGRYLHDIDVRDGLAYLSYLNDGLIILDVGNGMKGGSPSNPRLVSQFKYDFVAERKPAFDAGTPVLGATHTAFRAGRYVFIGDEILPSGGGSARAGLPEMRRAWGRLQVIDVSDIENPKSVAWYEPEFGGLHNVWVEGDTLYFGAYQAGFHAFDVSGELRGDLRAQQREMAHVMPTNPDTRSATNSWGAVVKNGLVYVGDMGAGLTIIRLEPKASVVP